MDDYSAETMVMSLESGSDDCLDDHLARLLAHFVAVPMAASMEPHLERCLATPSDFLMDDSTVPHSAENSADSWVTHLATPKDDSMARRLVKRLVDSLDDS